MYPLPVPLFLLSSHLSYLPSLLFSSTPCSSSHIHLPASPTIISSALLFHLPSSFQLSSTFGPPQLLLSLVSLYSSPSFLHPLTLLQWSFPPPFPISSYLPFLPAYHLLPSGLFLFCPVLPPLALPDVTLWPWGPLVKLDHIRACVLVCVTLCGYDHTICLNVVASVQNIFL